MLRKWIYWARFWNNFKPERINLVVMGEGVEEKSIKEDTKIFI